MSNGINWQRSKIAEWTWNNGKSGALWCVAEFPKMSSSTTRWCSRQTTVVLSNKWVVQFWKKWAFFNTDFSTYFKMCCMVCCIQIVLSCLPRKPPQSSLHPLSVSYMIVSGVMMMECGLVTVSVSPRQYSDPDQLHSPPVTAMCTHVITGHWTLL